MADTRRSPVNALPRLRASRWWTIGAVLAAACGSGSQSSDTPSAGVVQDGAAGQGGAHAGAAGKGGAGASGASAGSAQAGDGGEGGAGGEPGGSGGDAGAAGQAGAPGSKPDITPSDPIKAIDGVWTYVPFPKGHCRDLSQAHMMVHLNKDSKKVAIYEEGGGACFNDASCTFLSVNLPSYVLGGGIFNFLRPDNPIRDWNIFYVPYCTGDVHAGDAEESYVGPVTGKEHFAGYSNMKLYLARILATVPDATDLLLTGSSAGGFGAGLTADLVARNRPATVQRLTMLDDSGPPMSSKYLKPCLQARWQSVWGFQNSFLKDCGAGCPNPDLFIDDWLKFLIGKYTKGPQGPTFMAGLISSTRDTVISTFFGFGADDCKATVPQAIPPADFTAGLLEARASFSAQTDRFGTFFYDSGQHTTLLADFGTGVLGGLYDTKVDGVKLTDWIKDLLDHKQAKHVGP